MTRPVFCPDCGRVACASLCLLVGVAGAPIRSGAQTPARVSTVVPTPVESMASVVIGAMFMLDPPNPVLVESPASIERCAPLSCYRGDLIVRSNTRWQLQIRVAPGSEISAPITWMPLSAPSQSVSDVWLTVMSGATGTAGAPVLVRLGVGGASAQRPSGAQLAAAMQYRVIPLPP